MLLPGIQFRKRDGITLVADRIESGLDFPMKDVATGCVGHHEKDENDKDNSQPSAFAYRGGVGFRLVHGRLSRCPKLAVDGKRSKRGILLLPVGDPSGGLWANSIESMNKIVSILHRSNRAFLESHAQPGRVGVVGGTTIIENAIRRAGRHADSEKRWSLWSHTFLFEGKHADGHHWMIESDLEIHHKHVRLGVQENRITKFFDRRTYAHRAVFDFGLNDDQVRLMLREGLEMVASRSIYSLRELTGTLFALRHPKFQSRANLLAREKSCYCSAFVHHVFLKTGIDLAPGVHASHGTPEDTSCTPVPHTTFLLERGTPDN